MTFVFHGHDGQNGSSEGKEEGMKIREEEEGRGWHAGDKAITGPYRSSVPCAALPAPVR